MKDPFLPRYSPTNSDDDDKLLDIGDENIGNTSEDYSLKEDNLLMPDETQHKKEAGKLSSSKGHPLKTMKSSVKSLPVSKIISVSSSVSSSSKILVRKLHQQDINMQQDYLLMVFWRLQLILPFPQQAENLLKV